MNNISTEWNIYRTRFLVRARQLTQPVSFVDALGREHHGEAGDYLVEWSDGSRRVAPREIFEDVYVRMDLPERPKLVGPRGLAVIPRHRRTSSTSATA